MSLHRYCGLSQTRDLLIWQPASLSYSAPVRSIATFFEGCKLSSTKVFSAPKFFMDLSGVTNEVLRLLLAQNQLAISGTREQMIERLGTINVDAPTSRTRSSDSADPAAKRPRTNTDSSPVAPNLPGDVEQPNEEGDLPSARNDEQDPPQAERLQRRDTELTTCEAQDGVRDRGVPPNPVSNPAALATLIATIVDEKLKNFASTIPSPVPQQPAHSVPQPPARQQLSDPAFVASLLSQSGSSNYGPSQSRMQPASSSIAAHVPQKTRQLILRGEFVEFDSLLPENSCLNESELPGVSISFEGKQVNIPTPARKKKTHIDSIDRWLSAFAVFCTIFLTSFPHRAVEMFAYQEIIRSAYRKFAGFAWLSYDIDFRRKAAAHHSLNWGERDIQLYLLKFTGQAKSSCTICGSGDHFSHGCSLSALRPNPTQRGTCNNYNRGAKCSQDPCSFSHRCRVCNGEHPAYRHDDTPSKTRGQGDKKLSNR